MERNTDVIAAMTQQIQEQQEALEVADRLMKELGSSKAMDVILKYRFWSLRAQYVGMRERMKW